MARCELLAKTKALAIQRGLDESKVECPLINVCKGTRCYMFDEEEPEESELIANDLGGDSYGT